MVNYTSPATTAISDTRPAESDGKVWVDTSENPPKMKLYDSATGAFIPASAKETIVSQTEPTPEVGKIWFEPVQNGANMYLGSSTVWKFLEFLSAIPDSAGKHLYVADGQIEYYKLSTAYDISTRTLDSTLDDGFSSRNAVTIKPDGSKIYVYQGNDGSTYYQYDMTTAFDLSTATNQQTTTQLGPADYGGIQFNDDGSRVYISDAGNGSYIEQYDLSTAWDITSTATAAGDVSLGQGGQVGTIAFNADGTKLIWGERENSSVFSTSLSIPFDISSADTNNITSKTIQDRDGGGVSISADGETLLTRHWSPDIVGEYSLSTAFDITTLSFVDSFSLSGQAISLQASGNPWQI